MSDRSLQATNGSYCGEGCPAWGMWDEESALKHSRRIKGEDSGEE